MQALAPKLGQHHPLNLCYNLLKPQRHNAMQLPVFFAEKSFDIQTYEIKHPITGITHFITTDVVIDRILSTKGDEREALVHILQKLDFANADFHHFFKHLATGLVLSY